MDEINNECMDSVDNECMDDDKSILEYHIKVFLRKNSFSDLLEVVTNISKENK